MWSEDLGADVQWREQLRELLAIREAVLAEAPITTDVITGQDLRRPPASRTYTRVQQWAAPRVDHEAWTIDADVVIYPHFRTRRHETLACAGGERGPSTYGC